MNYGDKVEVTGPSDCHGDNFRGQTGTVEYFASSPNNFGVVLDGGMMHYFSAASLRLVPAFKPGDRVRIRGVDQNGTPAIGQIECVWHSEGRADCFQLDGQPDAIYTADELELLPKREPKAGEVWGNSTKDRQFLVTSEEKLIELNGLEVSFTLSVLVKQHGVYLAESLAAYFKARQ